MIESIKKFPSQFTYDPIIENNAALGSFENIIVVGMGGSHLAADILASYSDLNIFVHSSYGLPRLPQEILTSSLIIISSYSGNTEEAIDAFHTAREKKLSLAVLSKGGKLLELAKSHNVAYVQLPETGDQPRMALGLMVRALAKFAGRQDILDELQAISTINVHDYEIQGKALAANLISRVPVIYASEHNRSIAYNWKIKFNENSKIPAFYNVVPELNHNEMTGFDVRKTTKELSGKFIFIFITDQADRSEIKRRFDLLARLYMERGLEVMQVSLTGQKFEKVFKSLMLADWTSYHLAKDYGIDAESVPMVEEFKKLIK